MPQGILPIKYSVWPLSMVEGNTLEDRELSDFLWGTCFELGVFPSVCIELFKPDDYEYISHSNFSSVAYVLLDNEWRNIPIPHRHQIHIRMPSISLGRNVFKFFFAHELRHLWQINNNLYYDITKDCEKIYKISWGADNLFDIYHNKCKNYLLNKYHRLLWRELDANKYAIRKSGLSWHKAHTPIWGENRAWGTGYKIPKFLTRKEIIGK